MNKVGYFLLILIAFNWSCANRVAPTGGPKDMDPPEVLFISPSPGQRNFKGQAVVIEFNEYVTTNNLKEELIITPRIEGDYEYKIRKRVVIIEFEEPFADSTTYTLNFREGITDITEKNPAADLQLAFSTGDMLDTLTITGVAVDLLTKKPAAEVTVGLYPIDDTLDIFTGPPYYFTKTNANGAYQFRNIKDGEYRLYAVNDDNKDLVCQSDREPYAFLTHSIKLDTAYVADTLEMLLLNIDTLKITRTRSSGKYFIVASSKYLTDARLRAANDSTLIYKYDDNHRALKVYQTFPVKDSLQVFATLQDSLDIIVQDTFYLKFPATSRKPDEFKTATGEVAGSLTTKQVTGSITFSKPLKLIHLDSVVIRKDSLDQHFVKDQLSYTYDSLNSRFDFTISLPQRLLDSLNNKKPASSSGPANAAAPPSGLGRGMANRTAPPAGRSSTPAANKKTYTLHFPPATFISIEDDSSKAINQKLKFVRPAQTGLLSGKVTTSYKSYVVQLLSKEYEVVQEQKNVASYAFKEIFPGEYLIRVMVDENENGKWDPGNILLNIPPEKVFLYQDEEGNSVTAIRANWEITVDLSF